MDAVEGNPRRQAAGRLANGADRGRCRHGVAEGSRRLRGGLE